MLRSRGMSVLGAQMDTEHVKEAHDELHRLVGATLHTWAIIDRVLFRVFCDASELDEKLAGLFFFRMAGTGQRCSLVLDVVNLKCDDEQFKKRWARWQTDTEKLLRVRDLVAHNPVRRQRWITVGPSFDSGDANVYMSELYDIGLHAADLVNARRKISPHDLATLEGHFSAVKDRLRELTELSDYFAGRQK